MVRLYPSKKLLGNALQQELGVQLGDLAVAVHVSRLQLIVLQIDQSHAVAQDQGRVGGGDQLIPVYVALAEPDGRFVRGLFGGLGDL